MKKINIFLLSVMILGLLTSCGKKSVDTVIDTETSETATEIAEPTEKVSEEDTKDSEAVTEESDTEAQKQEVSNEETTDNHNSEADDNAGNGGTEKQTQVHQTEPAAQEEPVNEPEPATPESTQPAVVEQRIEYSPQNVVALATAKVQAGGKITLTDDLNNLLASGAITQEEYNEYYPYDGAGYYSIFVDSNMAEARDVSGTDHFNSEDDIATYIADMLLLENGDLFLIEYAGTYDYYGKQCYEFRCYRA